MKLKTLKPLEENTDSAEHDIGVREDFLSRTPFAKELRPSDRGLISRIDKQYKKY